MDTKIPQREPFPRIAIARSRKLVERMNGSNKKAKEFLKKVEHERGRPLRVLFLGNIACNSYNNAKILRDRGVDTFVITPNDFFVMSHPAWENEEVEIKFEKSFSPNWKELE